jgi:2,4-dienoyl-CoA reductase-like NADH-dependent reductase (Old Yellow Enzyme family)
VTRGLGAAVDATSNDGLSKLFTPFRLGSLSLPNRFVMPGMQRGWVRDGAPSPELASYYRRRVEGGVGLIIAESSAVDHSSSTVQPAACWLNPHTAGAWSRCVDAVRDASGHFLMQLWHEGGRRNAADGLALSPSGLSHPGHPNGRAATRAELGEIRDAFVRSALIAQSIGADGVEVHACHGYLLDQFLWAATNTRDDGYGGEAIADRARFPAEIVASIRAACGPDFVISFRFSQWKEHDYEAKVAATPDDLGVLLGMLRAAGANSLHASTRRFWVPEWPGSEMGLAGWTRRLGGLPTITVGSVGLDRDVMASFMEDGEAASRVRASMQELAERFERQEFDLVAVGRGLISDPDWVKKVRDGQYDAVRTFQKADIASLQWEW